jgi:hypothetical protein
MKLAPVLSGDVRAPVEQAMDAPARARTSLYGLKAMPTGFVKKFGKTR